MLEPYISGDVIRSIREAKGYTQKFVSDHIIRQSTYSKIERGEIEPTASKFFSLLDRLEMSVEEFLFIQQEYAYTEKGKILHNFTNQNFNDAQSLILLRKEAKAYVQQYDDAVIKDIIHLCDALIELSNSHDLKKARELVKPVWERIEKFDDWFLTELHLVNNILFFFPTETAIHITERAVDQLKKYSGFKASNRLRFNFQFNLAYLLLYHKEYHRALSLLEELISQAKKLKYHDLLALCYERKGIALLKIGDEDGKMLIEKGLNILAAIEEDQLKIQAENEIEKLLKE